MVKRIVILRGASTDCGGIERQIQYISEGLAKELGIEPILVTSSRNTSFAKAYAELGFPVEIAPHLCCRFLQAAHELDKIVRKYKAEIIQSHMFRESLVARAVRLRRPNLVHIARIHTYIDCSWIPKWRKLAYHISEKLTARGVDRFVPISQIVKKELINKSWIAPGRIVVVPNGAQQLGEPDIQVENGKLLPPRVIMVSNLLEHKGHDVLVRCLSELKHRGLKVRARLVGGEITNYTGISSPFTHRLKEMAREAGVLEQLEFYKYTRDVYGAIRDYPVLVLPSDREGLPNCILEAMSLRKLVVATRTGGVPEIITNGENGILHDVQDHESMADALEKIFTTPAQNWEQIRDCGLETWRARFTVESMISGFAQVYQELKILN